MSAATLVDYIIVPLSKSII